MSEPATIVTRPRRFPTVTAAASVDGHLITKGGAVLTGTREEMDVYAGDMFPGRVEVPAHLTPQLNVVDACPQLFHGRTEEEQS